MNTELYQHQLDAMNKMHNGCILCGKVGSGKSRTAIAYVYVNELGGSLRINGVGQFSKPELPKDIYIITTAKKRDTHEWEAEVAYFCLPTSVKVVIDSWNNIQKYKNVTGAVFIFDEQRLVGSGAWVKAFLKIAKKNHWILLSATPGDKWEDYIPVFLANGFYKSRSQFKAEHMVFKPYLKFPQLDHYVGTKKLKFYADMVLVPMDFEHEIIKHKISIPCQYNKAQYKRVMKDRWNVYDDCPIEETGKLCYLLRRVSNDDDTRYFQLELIAEQHKKVIVFYNFSYELHRLRYLFEKMGYEIGEWNGESHTEVPQGDRWAYLCQYTAACEGWNCITTDTIVFFSQNYSYKVTEQAAGRIDRMNTPFKELYYYYFRSKSPIDLAITRALTQKKTFNEKIFMKGISYEQQRGGTTNQPTSELLGV